MSRTATDGVKLNMRSIIQRIATFRVQTSDGRVWLDPTMRSEEEARE